MITFQTLAEEEDCKGMWEEYSPKKILWDLWDFRRPFHTEDFEFNFILGFQNLKKAGVMPLVFDRKSRVYTYFGDTFPENNKFFLKNRDLLEDFLYECPYYTSIYCIDPHEAKYYDDFEKGDKRYFLDLKKHNHSFESFLQSFNKKHRKNLNYDLKKLREKGYDLMFNRIRDFNRLVELNKLRFGKESDYASEKFVFSMEQMMENAKKNSAHDVISIKMDGNVQAISFGAVYNRKYYVLGVGRDPGVKNVGKLLIAEQIKRAIGRGCDEIDFLSTESNWKELWNLDSEQMYEFYS